MFPDAVMIAEDTRGPMNAEVLPTTENSAKNRNLQMTKSRTQGMGENTTSADQYSA